MIGKNLKSAEETLRLARFAEKIYFIIPSSKLEIPADLTKRLEQDDRIEMHFSASLKEIAGGDWVERITMLSGGKERTLDVAGVFPYMYESRPVNQLFCDQVELGEAGAVKVDGNLATSVKGIFACGDLLCGRPQLPAISSAQGLIAGLSVDKFLVTAS